MIKIEADKLSPAINICAARFNEGLELEDDEKEDFTGLKAGRLP